MDHPLSVVISGCHSGPNPSAGLGIARSLRLALPAVRLVGRDFSGDATGLHDLEFDEVWLAPPWGDADLELQRAKVLRRLDHAWLISSLDLEVRWLAALEHPRILAPPAGALEEVAKPGIRAGTRLGVHVPEWLPLAAGEQELHRFCRRHDWRVWVKGPAYEARLVRCWPGFLAASAELGSTWGEAELFVQAHVKGQEVSVAFAAHRGELLAAVFLEKLATTPEGKVWSGRIAAVPDPLRARLAEVIHELRWTGGGELEFIRDDAGGLWLFDWNPRFPAWIHGATLAGVNLPGELVARATGWPLEGVPNRSRQFVRQVVEVPAREGLELPGPPPTSLSGASGATKHPSGMPQLMHRLGGPRATRPTRVPSALPPALAADLRAAALAIGTTPARVLLPRTAEERFGMAAGLEEREGVQVAYSIKTNPAREAMSLARRHGLLAEAISRGELEWALSCGWPPGEIIYNGPVPLAPLSGSQEKLAAVFADDCAALRGYLAAPTARIVGVRLRPPFVRSRFGVPLGSPEEVAELAELLAAAPTDQALGVSFHLASSEHGCGRWQAAVQSFITFAAALSRLSGRSFRTVDLGGGWNADDFDEFAAGPLLELRGLVTATLGEGVVVVIEPGKALVEPAFAVFSRVVHLRTREGQLEAILDAGLCDVPLIDAYPHRLALPRGGQAQVLGSGPDRLLGSSCMETDCLASGVHLPDDLAPGDLVVILDAGGYDASLAYPFGRGGEPGHSED